MTIYRARFMHTMTNYLIAHLAMADLLVCATFLAFKERFVWSEYHKEDPFLCVLFKSQVVVWFAVNLSTASLVLITSERYIAIVYPLHYPRFFSSWRVKFGISGIWLLSAGLIVTQIFMPVTTADSQGCLQDLTFNKNTATTVYALNSVMYSIPTFAMIYCYGRILINLQCSARQLRLVNNAGHADDLIRAQRKVVNVLLMVAAIYSSVWVTMVVSNLVVLFFDSSGRSSYIVKQTYQPLILVLNSTVNPIIYALKYKEFQKA